MLDLTKYNDQSLTLSVGVLLTKGAKHTLLYVGDKAFQIKGSGYEVLEMLKGQEISAAVFQDQVAHHFAELTEADWRDLNDFIHGCIENKIIEAKQGKK